MEVDEINSGVMIDVVCPAQPVPLPADALATLGASASEDMVLFHFQHQKS